MARRKTTKSKGSRPVVVFWLAFVIVIICIFMANASTIQENFGLFWAKLTGSPTAEDGEMPVMDGEETITVVIDQTPSSPPQKPPESKPEEPKPKPEPKPEPLKPAQTTQPPKPQTPTETKPVTPPVQTRDRNVYFTNVGSDGQILQSKVTRKIPASDSPMQDSLNVLLKGPSSDEVGKGIVNLIPQNTRLLSAAVRGNTAYINFSEDFLFNTFGVEGYVAQLRQIVWTVTEFQNVKDVQILVEGRRLDYLGEGIWIGSPISRQSF